MVITDSIPAFYECSLDKDVFSLCLSLFVTHAWEQRCCSMHEELTGLVQGYQATKWSS